MDCCGAVRHHGDKIRHHGDKPSKLKKVIRLSPGSKKKHSKTRATEMDGSVPGSSGTTSAKNGTSKAKGNQRLSNGLTDIDNSLQQAFDMFDKNHDGKISCEELGCVLRTLGYKPTPAEIEDMIKNVDTNENGYVEFEEFLSLMNRHSDNSTLELLDPNSLEAKKREAFKVFDMDGNGYIDKHELKCVMGRLGEHLSDEDIKAMFNEADLNGDGLIDFEEFSRLHMS